MAKKSIKKAVKKQSVKEFKAWLEGITEFQPQDWCPSAEQWSTIKDKIGNLPDEMVKEVVIKETYLPQSNQPVQQSQPPRRVVSSLMQPTDENVQPLRMIPAGKIELLSEDGGPPEFVDIPVEIGANGQPVVQTVSSQVIASGNRMKTPHSKSGDKSPFA